MIHISFPLDKQSFDIQFMRVWIHQRMINWVIKKETRTITVRIIFGDEKTKAKNSFLVNALSKEYDSEPTFKIKSASSKIRILLFFQRGLYCSFLRADFWIDRKTTNPDGWTTGPKNNIMQEILQSLDSNSHF